jgi:cardiolipin synthase
MRAPGLFPLFLLILVLAVHSGAVRIVEFCPDPYLKDDPDEYVVLGGTGSLDGLTISDGEGGFRFPDGSRINGTVTVAKNAEAFRETHGRYPDF